MPVCSRWLREPMTDPDAMPPHRNRNMNQIKEMVDHGAYSVDPRAVADAILRRIASGSSPSGRDGSGSGAAGSTAAEPA